jgi:hypothetical protein
MATPIHNVAQPNPHRTSYRVVNGAGPMSPTKHVLDPSTPGIDTADFVRDSRIHIKHGSQFVDGYLVMHPRELAPANEAALREKLKLTYTIQYPPFFEDTAQRNVALGLASLIPTSLAAKHAQQQAGIAAVNAEVESGVDAGKQRERADRAQPMAANVRAFTPSAHYDPVGMETLKHGLTLFLLMREKMTAAGFMNPLVSYVSPKASPDQILTALGEKLGFTPLAMRDAALHGGVAGVANLLGVAPARLVEIEQVTNRAAQKNFSRNVVLDWNVGSQQLPMGTPLDAVLAQGLATRMDSTIRKAREAARGQYNVPKAIAAEEKRVAQSLEVLDPIQRALMHRLGYEICYSPEYYPKDIAFHDGIKGLNRRATNDPRSTVGTKRIYFSAYEGLEESTCVLAHEAAHMFWPNQFTPAEVQKIDALRESDAARFKQLSALVEEQFPAFEKFLRAYQAGNDAEKAAIKQTTNAYFAGYGVSIGDGLLPYLRDANQLRYLVKYASDKLTTEGAFYTGSTYNHPAERFREVISRFAELKQVRLRGEPEVMQFLAPGLNQMWENHYLPHLARVYTQAVAAEQSTAMPPRNRSVAAQADACIGEQLPTTSIAKEGAMFDGVGLTNHAIAAANSVLDAMGVGR